MNFANHKKKKKGFSLRILEKAKSYSFSNEFHVPLS